VERMKKNQEKMKESVNKDSRKEVFEVEEEVLLATKDFNLAQYLSRNIESLDRSI
jgi:hypothetical protein